MRVAIADHDPDIIEFLGKIVTEQGYAYAGFSDGKSLADALLRDKFDLIILDWSLPGKSGMQLLKWMEGALADRPPVIMMISRTAKQDISDALNAGADDYITKPEDKDVIAVRIRDYGGIWGLSARPDRPDGQTWRKGNCPHGKGVRTRRPDVSEPRPNIVAPLYHGNRVAHQCPSRHPHA